MLKHGPGQGWRLQPFKAMVRAWNRATAQMPRLLPHSC